MKRLLLSVAILLLTGNNLLANILRVPQDYPSIQQAVLAARNSDTVLVAEGTYYENVNLRGKNIVVASNYIFNKDPQTIKNTIVNGSHSAYADSGSVFLLISKEDSTTVLEGFTITGGTGSKYTFSGSVYQEGGGVILSYSSAIIRNNIIINNVLKPGSGVKNGGGGGISSMYGNPLICNNVIVSNSSVYACGIVLNWSGGKIKNNIIYHNVGAGTYGAAGVMIWASPQNSAFIENNTIVGNVSTSTAGGVLIYSTNPIVKNNIIWGNRQASGLQVVLPQYLSNNITEENYSALNKVANPFISEGTFLLTDASPAIDAGDTAAVCMDGEDPLRPGYALFPSKGMVRNDAGAFGGKYAKQLPLPEVTDIYISRTSLAVQCTTGQSGSAAFELLNLSTKPLVIDSITISDKSLFAVSGISSGSTMGVFDSDTIKLNFAPGTAGSYTDTVKIYYKGMPAAGPQKIPVNAKALGASDIKQSSVQQRTFCLHQNYPNPFNPETLICFDLPERMFVSLKVFDVLGKEIVTLAEHSEFASGPHTVTWHPENTIAGGVYFVRMLAGAKINTIKAVYLK